MAWVVVDLPFGVAHAATGRCSRESTEPGFRSQLIDIWLGTVVPCGEKAEDE